MVIGRHRRSAFALLAACAVLVGCSGTTAGAATAAGRATNSAGADASDAWTPTDANPDPSSAIPGIYVGDPNLYAHRYHFAAPDRVAYDRFPPVGGPHDPVWADCDGTVYTTAVRNENMVHTLEHGAVWIAYNPDTASASDLTALTSLVNRTSYLVMTPYPNLKSPISLQAWAHQLALDSAADPRLTQFIAALLRNPYLTPEVNATCSQPRFDIQNPPAFDPTPPGADAVPLDFTPAPATS